MNRSIALLIGASIMLTSLAAGVSAIAVEFQTPLLANGDITVAAVGQASIVGSGPVEVDLGGRQMSIYERSVVAFFGGGGIANNRADLLGTPWKLIDGPAPGTGHLTEAGTWGLAITGGRISWTAGNASVAESLPSGGSADSTSSGYAPYPFVSEPPRQPTPSVAITGNHMTAVEIIGDFSVELFGLIGTLEAQKTNYVTTGFTNFVEAPTGDAGATLAYGRVDMVDGFARISGISMRGVTITSNSTLTVSGHLLMPLANSPSYAAEQLPTGAWEIFGNSSLSELHPSSATRASGALFHEDQGLLIDSIPVNSAPSLAKTAASVTGLAGIIFLMLKALPTLSALLTRLPPEKALENKNRQTLNAYIKDHPGATFREVLRGTEMAAGTARHHLTVLKRSGVIAEHGHRSTLRFFENHGKFDNTWSAVVLLREKELEQVHEWLANNPEANQKDLLAHADSEWSWSRSTTQHRLARLIDGGLVTFRHAGRRKFYRAIAPEDATPMVSNKVSWT